MLICADPTAPRISPVLLYFGFYILFKKGVKNWAWRNIHTCMKTSVTQHKQHKPEDNSSQALRCKYSNRDSWYSWTCLCSLITRAVMHPRASSPNPREVYPLVIQQLTYHLSVCVRYLQFTASQCCGSGYFPIHPTLIMGPDWHVKPPPYLAKLSITFILPSQHPWFVSIAPDAKWV